MKAIILDRDGVINKCMPPHQYVTEASEIEYLKENIIVFSKIKKNIPIFIASNQQGVGKGLMTSKKLELINLKILNHLEKFKIQITKIYSCIHLDKDNCNCRKPRTGMLLKIAQEYGIELSDSLFIGDSETDIICASNAQCKSVYFGINKVKNSPTFIAENSTELQGVLASNGFLSSEYKICL